MAGPSSATRAPRRSRPRSSSRDGAPARAAGRSKHGSCASRAPSTAAPLPRWQRAGPSRQARPVRARARRLRARAPQRPRRADAAVGPDTCAVLAEPIQGEGGVWPLERAWLELARELCDRHGALLLYDEVQTGIGRCGAWFCAGAARVRPDATAVAKGLAGGLPIGALLAGHAGRRVPAGRSRHDVRRVASDRGRRAGGALRNRARGAGREREGRRRAHQRAAGALPGVDHVRGAGLLLGIELAEAPAPESRRRC